MNKLNTKAKWWEIALWILGTFSIGVVLGATIIGSILSLFFGVTYFSGIVGAALGVVAFYSYIFLKK